MAPPTIPLKDRFLSKVLDMSNPDACWLWKGARFDERGYGAIGEGGRGGRNLLAHRVSYELFVGPVPDGLVVLHSCDIPSCVNPKHLSVGTHQSNMDDMVRKGRSARRFGESNPCARLTAESVLRIRNLYHGGSISTAQIADLVGVSRQAVNHVVSGRRWKHLQEAV